MSLHNRTYRLLQAYLRACDQWALMKQDIAEGRLKGWRVGQFEDAAAEMADKLAHLEEERSRDDSDAGRAG
jgi:hypothetical protein